MDTGNLARPLECRTPCSSFTQRQLSWCGRGRGTAGSPRPRLRAACPKRGSETPRRRLGFRRRSGAPQPGASVDTYRVARLPARLRGFALPDTSTHPGGYVEAGDYLVLEEQSRYPTPDTDYARLLVPKPGALDTWVCTRWRTQRYATLVSQERAPAMARLSFDGEPLSVLEERLTTLLGRSSTTGMTGAGRTTRGRCRAFGSRWRRLG